MDNPIYQSPEAKLDIEDEQTGPEFYVVSIKKFSILFFATFGLYSIYWFYQNWRLYKIKHNEDVWPVARAIFSIFYAHALFEDIRVSLENQDIKFSWSPSARATSYVLISIIGSVADKLSMKGLGSPYSDIISILVLPFFLAVVLRVQRAINLSQGDQHGKNNQDFSPINIVWCTLGSILWVFVVIGMIELFRSGTL